MGQRAYHPINWWKQAVRWHSHIRQWLFLLLALHLWTQSCNAQVLNPPYFNIAEGRKVSFFFKSKHDSVLAQPFVVLVDHVLILQFLQQKFKLSSKLRFMLHRHVVKVYQSQNCFAKLWEATGMKNFDTQGKLFL